MTMEDPPPIRDVNVLKFTAVKVDVSALTSRVRHKAFVISNNTTSRDLTEMVLRKLGHETTTAPSVELLGDVTRRRMGEKRRQDAGRHAVPPDVILMDDYSANTRRTLTFKIIHKDVQSPAAYVVNKPTNGLTLPGYLGNKNSDLLVQDGGRCSCHVTRLGGTPDEAGRSRELMIHYAPHDTSGSANTSLNTSSGRLDLSGTHTEERTHTRSLNSSMAGPAHAHTTSTPAAPSSVSSEPPLRLNNGIHGNVPTHPCGRSSLGVGDISEGIKLQPPKFTRTVSDSQLTHALFRPIQDSFTRPNAAHVFHSQQVITDSNNNTSKPSLPSKAAPFRRSLPRVDVSEEVLALKKRSVTDLFAEKLKAFVRKSKPAKNVTKASSIRYNGNQRRRDSSCVSGSDSLTNQGGAEDSLTNQGGAEDDDMSVTSQEVADILCTAEPMRPYEDDSDTTLPPDDLDTALTTSGMYSSAGSNYSSLSAKDKSKKLEIATTQPVSLSDFVELSMISFMCNKPGSKGEFPAHSHHSNSSKRDKKTLSLFALLQTHTIAMATIARTDPARAMGVRLCDVSYVKCVRHVLSQADSHDMRLWEDNIPDGVERIRVVAMGGMEKRSTSITTGKLFRSDILLEVNGSFTLHMTAKEVLASLAPVPVARLILARPTFFTHRGSSP